MINTAELKKKYKKDKQNHNGNQPADKFFHCSSHNFLLKRRVSGRVWMHEISSFAEGKICNDKNYMDVIFIMSPENQLKKAAGGWWHCILL